MCSPPGGCPLTVFQDMRGAALLFLMWEFFSRGGLAYGCDLNILIFPVLGAPSDFMALLKGFSRFPINKWTLYARGRREYAETIRGRIF